MAEFSSLESYQALVDAALRDSPQNIRQNKAGEILTEAHKHLTRKEFLELEKHVFERLEK